MRIEMPWPVFKCAEDENIFFSRIHEIPGCDEVIGKDMNLYLILAGNPDETVLTELQEISNIWGTTFKVSEE